MLFAYTETATQDGVRGPEAGSSGVAGGGAVVVCGEIVLNLIKMLKMLRTISVMCYNDYFYNMVFVL